MTRRSAFSASRPTLPGFVAVGLFWGAFAAQVPDIKSGIGADDGAFGLALLCGAMGAVTAMWLAPRLDTWLGAHGMQAAALAMAAAFLFPGLAPTVPLFAAALFFCGAASGALDVVINARVSELEAAHDRGLMNLNHASFSFAYAASALMAGAAREAELAPFWVFLALGIVVVQLSGRMRLAPATASDEAAAASGPGFARTAFWAGLVTLAAFMTENATEAWSALHIERTLGGGAAEGALGPAVLGMTMGIGRLLGHYSTPRGYERTIIVVAAVTAGAGAALASQADTPAVAYVGFAILGFGVSVIAPLAFAIAGQMVRASDRARVISRTAVIGYCGFFVGPPMMGFISEVFGLRASFGVIAGLMLCVPLLLVPLRGGLARSANVLQRPRG